MIIIIIYNNKIIITNRTLVSKSKNFWMLRERIIIAFSFNSNLATWRNDVN